MENSESSDEMGLEYKSHLPIKWSVIDSEQAHVAINNSRFRLIIPLLEDSSVISKPVDRSSSNSDLIRLEAKLDVIIELIGQVCTQQSNLPVSLPVSISSTRIKWVTTESLGIGQFVLLKIYLSRQFMIPLELHAEITNIGRTDDKRFLVTSRFLGMDEQLHDWLEKYIFMQHRRQVAHTHHA